MPLAILRNYLENQFGKPRKQLLVMRPAAFEYAQLCPYFLDAAKLSQWLAKAGSIGKTGDACQLTLRGSGKLTGHVLAVAKWEVALSWQEIGGTLELKGFSMGPERVVGVRCMSWKQTANERKQLDSQLAAAVERLAAFFPANTTAAEGAGRRTPFEEKP